MTEREMFLKMLKRTTKEMLCPGIEETDFFFVEPDGSITVINCNEEEFTFEFDKKGNLFHFG